MAANRPGNDLRFHGGGFGQRMADNYVREMGRFGEKLAADLSKEGVQRILLAGRSAGAAALLALARSETLPVSAVYVAEPVGMYPTTPAEGRRAHSDYIKKQKEMDNETFVQPVKTPFRLRSIPRLASIAMHFPFDTHNNQDVWSTTTSRESLEDIAKRHPDIGLWADFASESMVASQETIDRMVALKRYRERLAPLHIEQVRNPKRTKHESFDNREFFAERARPAANYVIQLAIIDLLSED